MSFGLSATAVAGIAGAGIGAAGSIMSANSAADAQKYAVDNSGKPWDGVQQHLTDTYDAGQSALDSAMGMGTYSGPRVAGLNPYQTNGATQAGQFASGQGADIAGQLYGQGTNALKYGQQYAGNAQQMFDQAGQDQTQNFLDSASKYANNPYVDGIIDANSRDVTRNLNENQLPSLYLGAAGSGNTNSTRTGVAEGIAQRGAADKLADISSNIRSQFFSQGLSQAQSQYNTQQAAKQSANGQIGNYFQTGQGALQGAQDANAKNFDASQAAGTVFQQNEQQGLDANRQAFSEGQNNNLDLLTKYMNMLKGSYGNSQAVQPVASQNPIQGALGGALGAASIVGKLGSSGSSSTYNPATDAGYYSGFDNPANYG